VKVRFAQDDGNPGITNGSRHISAPQRRAPALSLTVEEVASWILIAALIRESHQTPLESSPLSLIIQAVTVRASDALCSDFFQGRR